jgi:hypothetical protein
MFYTGIDWADRKHDALALDESGHRVGSIRVTHTVEGLAKLDAWLSQILGNQEKNQMACIIETTHGLLIAFLLEHGWSVYPVLVGQSSVVSCFHIFPLVEPGGTHPLLTVVFLTPFLLRYRVTPRRAPLLVLVYALARRSHDRVRVQLTLPLVLPDVLHAPKQELEVKPVDAPTPEYAA